MAPKAKTARKIKKEQPDAPAVPLVSADDLAKADKCLENIEIKDKCKNSMYYALSASGDKEAYDAQPIAFRKEFARNWAASQLGNKKIFKDHVHTAVKASTHFNRTKKLERWKSKKRPNC